MVFQDKKINENEKQDHLPNNVPAYYFLKTSEMTQPSPLLPWNLFRKCSPEKSTGAKFIKLPNKFQAPQQGRNLPSYQFLTGAEPGSSEEHGRVGSSGAKHE